MRYPIVIPRLLSLTASILSGLALLAPMAASHASATESANLTVKGTLRPQACRPTVNGGKPVDFGTIPLNQLSATAPKVLPPRKFTLRIECHAPTRLMVLTHDNRQGTADTAAGDALIRAPQLWYGLGKVDGKAIGAYVVRRTMADPALGDGKKVAYLYSLDSHYWYAVDEDHALPVMRAHGWTQPGSRSPDSFKTIVQPWELQLAIASKSALPAGSAIPVDGLLTFTLEYL